MRKKLAALLLVSIIVIGAGANKLERNKKIKDMEALLQTKEAQHLFIEEWKQALNNSNYSEEDKKILLQVMLPFIDENFDKYTAQSLANLLSATKSTFINYVDKELNGQNIATYSDLICMLPFVDCFTDGIITINANDTEELLPHEYIHSISGWSNLDYVDAEIQAACISGKSYPDLVAITSMLGCLGNKEYLVECLINGTIDEYWEYLESLYPQKEELIKSIKKDIKSIFSVTYKTRGIGLMASIQIPARREVLNKISILFETKNGYPMDSDELFLVLASIYMMDGHYELISNPLFDDKVEYTYYGTTTSTSINNQNNSYTSNPSRVY